MSNAPFDRLINPAETMIREGNREGVGTLLVAHLGQLFFSEAEIVADLVQ